MANSHDGSMAVTAAATPIGIVCANILGAALRQAEHLAGRRYTARTNQVQRSFEDTAVKHRALELVVAA